ncbi:uncharacterized protein [Onthophagus taurus]|uniref:uncharacterized protein n=1 Tax=Onthophagus taurus TaxID=166361 RepID=UPI0039BE7518
MLSKNIPWICFLLLANTLQFSISQDVCRKSKSIKIDNSEAKCVNVSWYVYAGSVPCDGCCIRRNMVVLESGILQVTDTTTVNGQTSSVTFTAQRFNDYATYFVAGYSLPLKIVDTDCETYGVVYSEITNILQVFTAEPEQTPTFLSKLKGVKRCSMPLYEYNPELNC